MNGAPASAQPTSIAPRAPGSRTKLTSGTPGLAIPALSRAISSTVSPKMSVWSSATLVITETRGRSTLVPSSVPPTPASITATSTSLRANQTNASASSIS